MSLLHKPIRLAQVDLLDGEHGIERRHGVGASAERVGELRLIDGVLDGLHDGIAARCGGVAHADAPPPSPDWPRRRGRCAPLLG